MKYVSGDFGTHRWPTIRKLIDDGYLIEKDKMLVLTDKGISYCDKYHIRIV